MSDFVIDVNVGSPGDAPLISTQSASYDGPTSPTFFTVVGDFKAFIADTSGDPDADPDTSPITATVTFTPMIDTGDMILATHVAPRPTAYVPATITGTIGTDGRLKLASAPFGDYPFTPVRLLADTPLLELSSPLYYTVSFSNVIIDGKSSSIRSFTFQAPNADIELNLVTIYRQPGQPASGIVKIAPTGVRYEDGEMIFTYGGVDIPDPLPLSAITPTVTVGTTTTLEPGSEATVVNSGTDSESVLDFGIPHGEAATVSVGTVTNLAPGSAATVVNSGTSGDAVLDFGLPEGEAATITVGTVDVVEAGQPATVTNVGDNHDAVFDFEIPKGDAATVSVGTVTTVAPGTPAAVTNTGDANAAVFDFDIPEGEAATIEVGIVSNLAPNSAATVVNSGTTSEAVFNFGIPEGEAATVAVGSVTAVAPGQPATVENSGDNHNAVFDFEIPQGEAATVQVGTVTTVTENDPATVTNVGDTSAAVFDFEIPQGITGDTGEKGDAATVTIGTVTTVSPTSSASVTNVGTVYDAVLNFSIPKGDTGSADQTEWNSIPNKPAVVAEGATEADARDSIDAEYTGNKNIAGGYAGLDSAGKVPYSLLPSSIMSYQGVWNASTNTPTLADGTGDQGDTYRVTGNGSVNLGSGVIEFTSGDYVIFNGSTWEKSDGTDGVASVAGKTGAVTLTKSDVGLSDVDNTSDAAKPISTATQTALDGKEPTITSGVSSQYWRGDKTWQTLDKSAIGLANVDNTSDLNKPISTATQSALDAKEPTLNAGTTTQYYRGDKTWQPLNKTAVGLFNVDNTADVDKTVLSASKLTTARTINGISFDGTSNITVPAGISRSVQAFTSTGTLASASSTDYVYLLNASELETVSLLHFDENLYTNTTVDKGSSALSWWGYPNATITATGLFGPGYTQLYGSGARWTASPSWSFPASFTVEFWVQLAWTNIMPQSSVVFSMNGMNQRIYFMNGPQTSAANNTIALYNWGDSNIFYTCGSDINSSSFVHLAVVRSGGTVKLYLNGTEVGSTTTTGTLDVSSLQIGDSISSAFFIDEFRVSSVARYTGNFTVPTAAFPNYGMAAPTMPSANGNTNSYTLKNANTTLNCVVSAGSGQNIDGASSITLPPLSAVTLFSNGTTGWSII